MKKLLSLLAIASVLAFVFPPTSAEAGNYRSKRVGTCGQCHHSIYSYYRPVRHSDGCVTYSWVTSHHNNCRSSSHNHSHHGSSSYSSRSSRSYNSYSRPSYSYRYSTPSYRYSRGGNYCR